jgi:flagellar biosynthetic protein FliQ
MYPDLALHMMRDLLWSAIVVCAPVLGLTMLVGLVISILQVVTQVQEMSLTFVPKLLAAAVAIIVFGAWMLRELARFSVGLWANIPSLF